MQKPLSATHATTWITGFIVFILSMIAVKHITFSNFVYAVYLVITVTFLSMSLMEVMVNKTWKNKSTGFLWDINAPRNLKRVGVRLTGLVISIGFVAFFYFLLPEYHGNFYVPFWRLINSIYIPFWILAGLYFYSTDNKLKDSNDSYYQVGSLIWDRKNKRDGKVLKHHFLGWVVKGFFLPLMFVYFHNNMRTYMGDDFLTVTNFHQFFDVSRHLIFTTDLGFAAIGYAFSLRIFDSHIRSAEPTMVGWTVALFCYQPFWSLMERVYMQYGDSYTWMTLWNNNPVMYKVWGTIILILLSIFTLSTISFGLRFSNVTHRGIITSGPYRFTKHPAYVSKCLSWWFISVPFIVHGSWQVTLQQSLILLALNTIYFLRAKTEERHLMQDPTYQQYASWIDKNGLFRFLNPLVEKFNFRKLPSEDRVFIN